MEIRHWLAKQFASWAAILSGGRQTSLFLNSPFSQETSQESLVNRSLLSWVYKCCTLNAQALARVQIRLYQKAGQKRFPTRSLTRTQRDWIEKGAARSNIAVKAIGDVEEVMEHPALELLRKPSPNFSGFYLREMTAWWNDATGNAYWYLPRNGIGVPDQIVPLYPQFVKVIPGTDTLISGYEYGSGASKFSIAPEEVCRFPYPNPKDLLYGLGPLQAAIWAVDRDSSMSRYKQSLWDNQARPDFLLKSDVPTTAAQRKQIRAEFEKLHRGTGSAGKVGILPPDISIAELSFTPREVALINEAQFDRDTIFAMFGVPISFAAISQSRAEAEAHYSAWMSATIAPRCTRFEQWLNLQYVPMFDAGENLFFMHDDPVPANVERRLAEIQTRLSTGMTTVNEERQLDNWEPTDGGDVRLVPAGMKAWDYEPPPPQPFGAFPDTGMGDDADEEMEDEMEDDTEEEKARKAKFEDVGTTDEQRKLREGYAAALRRTFRGAGSKAGASARKYAAHHAGSCNCGIRH